MNFFRFYGFFLPRLSRLDVHSYASRLEKQRFSPKSAYPQGGDVTFDETEKILRGYKNNLQLNKKYK